MRHKDTLMLEYLYDYPVFGWVIEAEEARYAVETFLARVAREEMRRLGVSVFAEDTPFSWWIRGEEAPIDVTLLTSHEFEAVEDEQEGVREVEGMEVEQEAATPELNVTSPRASQSADPAASEGLQGSKDEHTSNLPQDNTTETPTVDPEPRRSSRVAQQKLKEEHDQQVMEESLQPIPRTTQTKKPITLPKRSKQKSVQSRQQEIQRPRRRSIRVSAKRTFADEPWSAPKN